MVSEADIEEMADELLISIWEFARKVQPIYAMLNWVWFIPNMQHGIGESEQSLRVPEVLDIIHTLIDLVDSLTVENNEISTGGLHVGYTETEDGKIGDSYMHMIIEYDSPEGYYGKIS